MGKLSAKLLVTKTESTIRSCSHRRIAVTARCILTWGRCHAARLLRACRGSGLLILRGRCQQIKQQQQQALTFEAFAGEETAGQGPQMSTELSLERWEWPI